MKIFRRFEVVCVSCRTIYNLDFKLPPGVYQFSDQPYGKDVITRFTSSDCPFCTFDEDILKDYEEKK